MKNPFLFHSEDLMQILGLVEASRTRMSVLQMLVPRLIDPKGSADQAQNMFRFAEEKAQVEELYKERIQIVNASMFKRVDKTNNVLAGGRGRGRGNRTTQVGGRPVSLPASLDENISMYTPFKTTDGLSADPPADTAEEGK